LAITPEQGAGNRESPTTSMSDMPMIVRHDGAKECI
jgi:hypothetical protein